MIPAAGVRCMVHLSQEVWFDHTFLSEPIIEVEFADRAMQEMEYLKCVVEVVLELNVVAGLTTSKTEALNHLPLHRHRRR